MQQGLGLPGPVHRHGITGVVAPQPACGSMAAGFAVGERANSGLVLEA